MNARRWFSIHPPLLALAVIFLAGCERSYQAMALERAAYATRAQGPIFIAAIEDHDPTRRDYLKGLHLAVDEINGQGGLLGRPLAVQVFAGASSYKQTLPVIRSIVANPSVSAVLGHRTSSVAIPASVVYEAAEVLLLPAFATDPRLTLHGFQFVLRTLPDNQIMAAQSASVAALFGYETIAVLYSRDDYSRELAFLFEDAARQEGLRIVFRGSFFEEETNYRTLIGRMNSVDFDAIYLSTGAVAGARALRQLREMGMRQPVIGSDTIAGEALAEAVGTDGDRTISPTVYALESLNPQNNAFVAAYRAAYGADPNWDAAQGYDATHLFAEIVRQAGSTEPRVLAAKAHYIDPVAGVTGLYAFDEHGDIYGKHYNFQILRAGRWRPLFGVTAPYLLNAFRDYLAHEAEEAESPPEPDESPAVPDQATQLDPTAAYAVEDAQSEAGEAPLLERAVLEDPRAGRLAQFRVWLALAHAILDFESLGVIVSEADQGSALANMVQSVGERLGFSVEVCRLPALSRGAQTDGDALAAALERLNLEALRCYSQLSVRIEAMLVSTETDLTPTYLRRLNEGLRAYQIPAFALLEKLDADYGLSMALVSAGVDFQRQNQAQQLDGVLKEMRVYDLSRRLAALPSVIVDLEAFEDIGRPLALKELSVISGNFTFTDSEDPAASMP